MKILKVINTLLYYGSGHIFYVISSLIPKNKSIWIFGAWLGKRYSGNSKYLFEFVNKEYPDIKAIWLAHQKKVVDTIRQKGYEAYNICSIKGIWYSMRCKIAIICQRKRNDVNPFCLSRETKVVQLWHGIPLKKIGFDDRIFSVKMSKESLLFKLKILLYRIVFPFFLEDYDMIIATSEEMRTKMASAFNVAMQRIPITGYPRNDPLISSCEKNEINNIPIRGIYMPTFRGNMGSEFVMFEKYDFKFETIEEFFEKRNIHFYLRMHSQNKLLKYLLKKISKSRWIHFDSSDDIYESLSTYDFLITDYSSIFFDYLLLDRPIIFAPFDRESYCTNEREFYYPYDEYTPGPKARDWDEVLGYIDDELAKPDRYKEERRRIRDIFHYYQDPHSCERVCREIRNRFLNI